MDTKVIDSTLPATPPVDDRRGAAIALHLCSIPFGFIPAIVGIIYARNRSDFLRQHARQALNLQFNLLALYLINYVLLAVYHAIAAAAPAEAAGTGDLIALVGGASMQMLFNVLAAAMFVWAAVRAKRGEWRPYPRLIPFLKDLPQPASA